MEEPTILPELSHPENEDKLFDPLADSPATEPPKESSTRAPPNPVASPSVSGLSSLFGIDVGLLLPICLCVAVVAYEYQRTIGEAVTNDAE